MPDLPPHAYIPGKTTRHPEGYFDDVKGGILRADPSHLAGCAAWTAGLQFYEAGYFWETHEVLEAVWLSADDESDAKTFVQCVIQLANARLKVLMGKPRAVQRICDEVDQLLDRLSEPVDGRIWSIDDEWVRAELRNLRT